MILEIAGLQVKLVYTDTQKITLISNENQLVTLKVPALLPQNELLAFVKLIKKTKLKNVSNNYDGDQIQLFDTKYPIRIIYSSAREAYLDQGIVYMPQQLKNKLKNSNFLEDVKLLLFKSQIMKLLSKWEETLNMMLDDVKFRKLKTNIYVTCSKSNAITWNTALMNYSLELIDYVVLDAMLSIKGNLSKDNDLIKNKYIRNWKSYQRIIDYESRNTDATDKY